MPAAEPTSVGADVADAVAMDVETIEDSPANVASAVDVEQPARVAAVFAAAAAAAVGAVAALTVEEASFHFVAFAAFAVVDLHSAR